MEEKNIGYFLTVDFVLLITFIGLILITFDLTGTLLIAHILFTILLLVLTFTSLVGIYYNMRWGRLLIISVFSLIVLDEVFIYILTRAFGTVFMVSFIAGLVGLIISLANIKGNRQERQKLPEEKLESIEKVEVPTTKGKYLASKAGKNYHISDCIFAKNISKDNQVWLEDKEDASTKGYKAHNCVK